MGGVARWAREVAGEVGSGGAGVGDSGAGGEDAVLVGGVRVMPGIARLEGNCRNVSPDAQHVLPRTRGRLRECALRKVFVAPQVVLGSGRRKRDPV